RRLFFPRGKNQADPASTGMHEATRSLLPCNLNTQQLQFCNDVIWNFSNKAPFLLFGPPGTGKTRTLCAVTQAVLRLQATTRILACTPTNAAAETFFALLMDTFPTLAGKAVRFVRRDYHADAQNLIYRNAHDNYGLYYLEAPAPAEVFRYRIV